MIVAERIKRKLVIALILCFMVLTFVSVSHAGHVYGKNRYSVSQVYKKISKKFDKIDDYTVFEVEFSYWKRKYSWIVRYQGGKEANIFAGVVYVNPKTGKAVWKSDTGKVVRKWRLFK